MDIQILNKYFENFSIEHDSKITCSPIFIVGAPRSGTTFLYQLIVSMFNVEYPTNFIAKFWGNPVVGYILQSELLANEKEEFVSSFKSHHGFTENELLEPHEFGYFWSRWFDHSKSHYTSCDAKVNKDLIHTIDTLQTISNKNWVFKNLTLGLKIPLIKKLFPNAKFIYIQRDPYDTALSLYKGRIERFGSDEAWWSLEPKEINEIKKLSPKEQVVAQVYYINKQIEEDLHKLSSDDYLQIDYDLFETNVKGYTAQLKQLLGAEIKNHINIPFKKNTKENQYSDLLKPFVKKYKLLKDNQWS